MAFILYIVGFVVFVAGLASLATALGMADTVVTGLALVLIAIALGAGLFGRRTKESRAPT